jgi:sugar-specific transcriptional regulator TrmB
MKNSISVSSLQNLGLNAYQAKAYLALLERNTLTATEVATLAGIPRPRIYEILQTLMSKGLCVLRPGRFKTYGATDPSALKDMLLPGMQSRVETELENLRKEERKLVLKKKEMSSDVDSLIHGLLPIYEKGSSNYSALEYIEVIKDPYQMHKRYMQLCAEVQKEIVGFAKPPYSRSREGIEEQHAQQAQLMQRGVRLRSIYEIPKDKQEIEWWFETIDTAAKHGEEARVLEELPVKMAIFDSRIVMLPLEDPVSVKPSLTAQIVEHRALANALKILFETLWEQAQDYHVLRG